jgi:hypothetical protein
MKLLLCLLIISLESVAFAQNFGESKNFSNAFFSGPLSFTGRQNVGNGRYCKEARKIKLSNSPIVQIEGGLAGEIDYVAYSRVNGIRGAGFFGESPEVSVNYVSAPSETDPAPRGRQKFICGVFSTNTHLEKIDDRSAYAEHSEYIGCREKGRGRGVGNFYTCYERKYVGVFNRTSK